MFTELLTVLAIIVSAILIYLIGFIGYSETPSGLLLNIYKRDIFVVLNCLIVVGLVIYLFFDKKEDDKEDDKSVLLSANFYAFILSLFCFALACNFYFVRKDNTYTFKIYNNKYIKNKNFFLAILLLSAIQLSSIFFSRDYFL